MRWVMPLMLLAIATLLAWLMFGTEPPPRPDLAKQRAVEDALRIEGLDWVALSLWLMDYFDKSPHDDADRFARDVSVFASKARYSGAVDTVAQADLTELSRSVEGRLRGRSREAQEEAAEVSFLSLLAACEDERRWFSLQRALGPGVMAGIAAQRAQMVESLTAARARMTDELTTAGEAQRVLLERDLETARRTLAILAKVPEPSDDARAMWTRIQADLERRREEERRRVQQRDSEHDR